MWVRLQWSCTLMLLQLVPSTGLESDPIPNRTCGHRHTQTWESARREAVNRLIQTTVHSGPATLVSVVTKTSRSGSSTLFRTKMSHSPKNFSKTLREHIEATSTGISSLGHSNSPASSIAQLDPLDIGRSISQVASGVPSLHTVSSRHQLRSRHGSVESLRSNTNASDEKSRVTSWTNSDSNTHSTVTSGRGDHERQRLSVINEHGMHVSLAATRAGNQSDDIATPLFSALMKRVDNSKVERNDSRGKATPSNTNCLVAAPPPRDSNIRQGPVSNGSPATIRQVKSSANLSPRRAPEAHVLPVLSNPDKDQNPEVPQIIVAPFSNDLSSSVSAPLGDGKEHSHIHDRDSLLAPDADEGCRTRSLSSRSSAFFGSPTCHMFRTKSPYRKALQDTMKIGIATPGPKSPAYNPWMRSLTDLNLRCPSASSDDDQKMHYTDSIYSESPGHEQLQPPNILSIMDKFPRPPATHGDATIYLNPSRAISPQRMTESARVPAEWKDWLSAKVSKLDGNDNACATASPGCTASKTVHAVNHVRERAQINEEDSVDDNDDHDTLPNPDACLPTTTNSAARTDEHSPDQMPRDTNSNEPYHLHEKTWVQTRLQARRHRLASSDDDDRSVFL
ncbi:hypothetical protein Micbo1qcDRAFT_173030 [Microdochium bolleyi]|uniref:Uncharacterized protein n=1 Tax=Microdochium bolleyi TaxID=196109 RepID=A0A136JAW2_9PEZI|nr:hypothetical protein Micbo1qcDRAFT_173030 [Microdochium bolleyi]